MTSREHTLNTTGDLWFTTATESDDKKARETNLVPRGLKGPGKGVGAKRYICPFSNRFSFASYINQLLNMREKKHCFFIFTVLVGEELVFRQVYISKEMQLKSSCKIISYHLLTFFVFFFLETYASSIKPSWEGLGSKISTIRWRKNTCMVSFQGLHFSSTNSTDNKNILVYIHRGLNRLAKLFLYL